MTTQAILPDAEQEAQEWDARNLAVDQLLPGVYPVEVEGVSFLLSVTLDKLRALIGVHGFQKDEARPKRGKHLQKTEMVRQWLVKMTIGDRLPEYGHDAR